MDLDNQEKEIKERIGVVFDECCFHDNLTPCDILKILGNIYENWDGKLFQKYLAEFGLAEKKNQRVFPRAEDETQHHRGSCPPP